MTMPQSVAEISRWHDTLDVDGINWMHLNIYVSRLQFVEAVLVFIRRRCGHPVAFTRMAQPITCRFVAVIEQFAHDRVLPPVCFDEGSRKEEVAAQLRAAFSAPEGVVFIVKAQEKRTIYRTERHRNPRTGKSWA